MTIIYFESIGQGAVGEDRKTNLLSGLGLGFRPITKSLFDLRFRV